MIKKILDNYLFKIMNKSLDKSKFQSACSYFNLARPKYKNIKKIFETEYKVYSQNGEDGIIDYILYSLNIEKPKFVEIGVGDYSESNTRFLFERTSCTGLIIDNIKDFKIKVHQNVKTWKGNLKILNKKIYPDNIIKILKEDKFLDEIDLFSLDIDGIDYWILKELPIGFCKILVVEYNPYFGSKLKITVPNIKDFNRTKYHYSNLCFGASLPAIIDLLKEKNLSFIGTNLFRNNAFFVKNDFVSMLNLEKVNRNKDLDFHVNANFRESRDINGKLSFINPQKILQEIKDCYIVDLSDPVTKQKKILDLFSEKK